MRMTAIDELRRLLDERGVEHTDAASFITWNANGVCHIAENNPVRDNSLTLQRCATPEQAIAATLGAEDAFTRDDVESAFVSGYSLGLDMFDISKQDAEKGWNQNKRDLDEEMSERGWVRSYGSRIGRTTTRNTMRTVYGSPRPVCEVCGYGIGDKRWHYCPKCGSRILEGDE